ncbi:MAG: hAT transposon family protein [Planctomycetota bacterium]
MNATFEPNARTAGVVAIAPHAPARFSAMMMSLVLQLRLHLRSHLWLHESCTQRGNERRNERGCNEFCSMTMTMTMCGRARACIPMPQAMGIPMLQAVAAGSMRRRLRLRINVVDVPLLLLLLLLLGGSTVQTAFCMIASVPGGVPAAAPVNVAPQSGMDLLQQEVTAYLAEPELDLAPEFVRTDTLSWWAVNEKKYPHVALVAKKYHAMQIRYFMSIY